MRNRTSIAAARNLAGGALILAALLASVHFGAQRLGAQSRIPFEPQLIRVDYGLAAVDQIYSTDRRGLDKIKIEKATPLGANNAYIVHTNESLIVFRVENKDGKAKNIRLGDIPLLDPVEEITILDDNASFLVRTKKGIAVWAVTTDAIYTQEED